MRIGASSSQGEPAEYCGACNGGGGSTHIWEPVEEQRMGASVSPPAAAASPLSPACTESAASLEHTDAVCVSAATPSRDSDSCGTMVSSACRSNARREPWSRRCRSSTRPAASRRTKRLGSSASATTMACSMLCRSWSKLCRTDRSSTRNSSDWVQSHSVK
eukprot:scaffold22893_cov27-Tisochrysis_lutea.AAC.7